MTDRNYPRATVLVLGTTVPASPGDGTPEFVLDLSRQLTDEFDVVILAPRVPGAPRQLQADGVRIVRFPYFPRRWELLADGAILPNLRSKPWLLLQVIPFMVVFLVRAWCLVRRLQPSVIHAHWIVPGGLIAALLSRFTGVPYIVTVHGADAFALQGRTANVVKSRVLAGASHVGLTSQQVGEALPPACQTPREVIPMGVDVERFGATVGERCPEKGRFLFVGRLADKKGVDVLLEAVADVPDASVIIAGDGPQDDQLRSYAQSLDVSDRAEFVGRVSRPELASHLQRAYAVVVPSRVARDGDQDTTPLVMSEAMSVGVPVIASRLGGLAERIDHATNGLLVEPGSPGDLADALRWALDHEAQIEELGRVGKERLSGGPLDVRTAGNSYRVLLTKAADLGTATC